MVIMSLCMACTCSPAAPRFPPPDGPRVTVQLPEVAFTIRVAAGMRAINTAGCDAVAPPSDLIMPKRPCLIAEGEPAILAHWGRQTFTFGLSRHGPPLTINQSTRSDPELTESRPLPNGNTFVYTTWIEQEGWDRPRFYARGHVLGPDGAPRLHVACSDYPPCLSLVDTISIVPDVAALPPVPSLFGE